MLYESTGKVVDVSGFYDSLDSIKGIQVGTCVTAVDLNDCTIIASFSPKSVLWRLDGDIPYPTSSVVVLWYNGGCGAETIQ
jgi:hypothetical protein